MSTTAAEILRAAAQHMEDRAATYDNDEGERSLPPTVVAFNAVTGHTLTAEQGWLFMALLKAVRSQQGDYRADSYEDGAAYFALAGEQAALDRAGTGSSYTRKGLKVALDRVEKFMPEWAEEMVDQMSDEERARQKQVIERMLSPDHWDGPSKPDSPWSPWTHYPNHNFAARDKDGEWYLYENEPKVVEKTEGWCMGRNNKGDVLSPDDQDAMRNWASSQGVRRGDHWTHTLIRRGAPVRVVPPLPDEMGEPFWKFLGRDAHGQWWEFAHEPARGDGQWVALRGKTRIVDHPFRKSAIEDWACTQHNILPTTPWQDTLIERT